MVIPEPLRTPVSPGAMGPLTILYEVLAIRRETLGPRHEAVGRTLYNIAVSLETKGDLANALDFALQAVEIAVEQYGPEHPGAQQASARVEGIVRRSVSENGDVRFDIDPGRIERLVAKGVTHPFLDELAPRLR